MMDLIVSNKRASLMMVEVSGLIMGLIKVVWGSQYCGMVVEGSL